MEFEAWQKWSGADVAMFVSSFCGLPEYAPAVRHNLTGPKLHHLVASGMLGKGLARAGIHNFDHQRLITTAVTQLGLQSPPELHDELRSREEARTGSKPAWLKLHEGPVAPGEPRPAGNPRRGQKFKVPVLPRLPDPLPPAGLRYNPEQEEELSRRSRTTPRPYAEDPCDGTPPHLSEEALGCVRRFRERVAKSSLEYETMVFKPEPARPGGAKTARQPSRGFRMQATHSSSARGGSVRAQGLVHSDRADDKQATRSVEEGLAAIKIQALRRGNMARREQQAARRGDPERRRSSDRDSSYKQHVHYPAPGSEALIFQEQRELRQHAAAAQLQAMHRGNLARRRVKEKREDVERQRLDQEEAARRMQEEAERQRLELEEAERILQEDVGDSPRDEDAPPLEDSPGLEAAALRIQAVARGNHARREVEAMLIDRAQHSQDELPPEAASEQDSDEAVADDPESHEEAEEAVADGPRSHEEAEEAAAMRIQATFRGNTARREVEGMLHQQGEAVPEGAEHEGEEELPFDDDEHEGSPSREEEELPFDDDGQEVSPLREGGESAPPLEDDESLQPPAAAEEEEEAEGEDEEELGEDFAPRADEEEPGEDFAPRADEEELGEDFVPRADEQELGEDFEPRGDEEEGPPTPAPELEAAATRIQALYRGAAARKDVEAMLHEDSVIYAEDALEAGQSEDAGAE